MKVNIFTVTHFDNPAPKHQGGYVAFGFQQNLHSLWICSPFGHATALLVHLCAELSATFHLLVAESSFWFWLLHELLDILLERLHGPLAKVKPPYFQSCYISNISFCKPQLIPHAVKRTPDAVSNVLCCLSWPAECPHVFQFVHMDVGVLWQWKDGFKQKKKSEDLKVHVLHQWRGESSVSSPYRVQIVSRSMKKSWHLTNWTLQVHLWKYVQTAHDWMNLAGFGDFKSMGQVAWVRLLKAKCRNFAANAAQSIRFFDFSARR